MFEALLQSQVMRPKLPNRLRLRCIALPAARTGAAKPPTLQRKQLGKICDIRPALEANSELRGVELLKSKQDDDVTEPQYRFAGVTGISCCPKAVSWP
jgi:hypothetical protein